MTDFNPQQLGKLILLTGIIISAIGAVIILLGHFGLFKLPGDIEVGGKNWKFYFPVVSCVIISIIIRLVIWIVNIFR